VVETDDRQNVNKFPKMGTMCEPADKLYIRKDNAHFSTGSNPEITSDNATGVKINNAANSIARFEKKLIVT
jgi:hypothetical protein